MQTTIALLSLCASVLALPTPVPIPQQEGGAQVNWVVSNYSSGCSPAGCAYSFNITLSPSTTTAAAIGNEPPFSTYCQGTDIQTGMVKCNDPTIVTTEVPGLSNATLVVEHHYTTNGDEETPVTVVGNATIVSAGETGYAPPATFGILQGQTVVVKGGPPSS